MVSDLVSDVCVGQVVKHLFRCASSLSRDSSMCHYGKKDSYQGGADKS
jgi:hypothetical protein